MGNKAYITTITPQWAKYMLEHNSNNRRLNPDRVKALVKDIKEGHWEFTGEPIRISNDGELIDGQHRLSAILQAGIPVESVVAFMNPTVHVDDNQTRNVAQRFVIGGICDKGSYMANSRCIATANYIVKSRNAKISDAMILNFLTEHENAFKNCVSILAKASGNICGTSMRTGWILAAALKAYEDGVPASVLIDWHKVLRTGVADDIEGCKATISLRNQIINNHMKTNTSKNKSAGECIDEFHLKAQYAILNYWHKTPTRYLKAVECFPLKDRFI